MRECGSVSIPQDAFIAALWMGGVNAANGVLGVREFRLPNEVLRMQDALIFSGLPYRFPILVPNSSHEFIFEELVRFSALRILIDPIGYVQHTHRQRRIYN